MGPKFCQKKALNSYAFIHMLGIMRSHYDDVIISAMASQTISVSIVCSTVCWGANQRKYRSSASLVFVRGIHRWPVDSHHKGPVTRKMFPFDDVIMIPGLPVPSLPVAIFEMSAIEYGDSQENAEKRKLSICTPQHVIVTDLQYSHLNIWFWGLKLSQ